ncbi:hypothetical protein JHK87_019431 [Glycine soja]|nr:hypothetical protein JHK87_019431 [Glycine soja]
MSHNVDVNSDENDNGDKGDVRIENVEDREDATNEEDRRIVGLVSDEINVLDFGSEEHAFIFYREYARSHGFVVRKYDVSQNVAGNINKCQFICNKEANRIFNVFGDVFAFDTIYKRLN